MGNIQINLKQKDTFDHEPWNRFQKEIFSTCERLINLQDDYEILTPTTLQVDTAYYTNDFVFPINKIFDIARDGKYSHIICITKVAKYTEMDVTYIYEELTQKIVDLDFFFAEINNKPADVEEIFQEFDSNSHWTSFIDFKPYKILVLIDKKNLPDFFKGQLKEQNFSERFLEHLYVKNNVVLPKEKQELQPLLKEFKKEFEELSKTADIEKLREAKIRTTQKDYLLHELEMTIKGDIEDELEKQGEKNLYKDLVFGLKSISEYTEEKFKKIVTPWESFYLTGHPDDRRIFMFPNIIENKEENGESLNRFTKEQQEYNKKYFEKVDALYQTKGKKLYDIFLEQNGDKIDTIHGCFSYEESKIIFGESFAEKYKPIFNRYYTLSAKFDSIIQFTKLY